MILDKYAISDIVNLTKSDVVVLCDGSKDVYKNNIALKHPNFLNTITI